MSAIADLIRLPTAASPVERVLSRFSRDELHGFVAVALDLLDLAAGDADREPDGDELDGSTAEDDYGADGLCGPGCSISDPPEEGDSDCCTAGDDMGGNPNLPRFNGFSGGSVRSDDDERWHQPAHLPGGGGA